MTEYVRIAHPNEDTVRITIKARDINRPTSVVITLDNWLDLLQVDAKQIEHALLVRAEKVIGKVKLTVQ